MEKQTQPGVVVVGGQCVCVCVNGAVKLTGNVSLYVEAVRWHSGVESPNHPTKGGGTDGGTLAARFMFL